MITGRKDARFLLFLYARQFVFGRIGGRLFELKGHLFNQPR